jgi:hypothetical protein
VRAELKIWHEGMVAHFRIGPVAPLDTGLVVTEMGHRQTRNALCGPVKRGSNAMVVSRAARHGIAAGASVVIAAAVGVLTNLVTDRWQPALVLALLALVLAVAALEIWLAMSAARSHGDVAAIGTGSVAVGRNNEADISTKVRLSADPKSSTPVKPEQVSSPGPGAVAIGGDNSSHISTDIRYRDFPHQDER